MIDPSNHAKQIDVSVIMPCRNENDFIARSLESLLMNNFDKSRMEILVFDGMSDDGTKDILRKFVEENPIIRVFDNPAQSVPEALELGRKIAKGAYFLRVDAHCIYPGTYIRTLVEGLENNLGDNVGCAISTVCANERLTARAAAAIMAHPLGVGISHRTIKSDRPMEVDTVPFGAWRKDILAMLGGFDVNLIRAQDLDFNVRMRIHGMRVVLLPGLEVTYFARDSVMKMARMFYQSGYWKVRVNHKNRVLSSVRQLAPVGLVCYTGLCLLLFPLGWRIFLPVWLGLGIYACVVIASSVGIAFSQMSLLLLPYLMLGFVAGHFNYGLGYLKGLVDTYLTKKTPKFRRGQITR